MTKLSKRANDAIEIMKQGGYFRKALETNRYTMREQFETRLYDANRNRIRGIGIKTKFELEDAGMLKRRDCLSSSTWPEEWILA